MTPIGTFGPRYTRFGGNGNGLGFVYAMPLLYPACGPRRTAAPVTFNAWSPSTPWFGGFRAATLKPRYFFRRSRLSERLPTLRPLFSSCHLTHCNPRRPLFSD